MVIRRKIEPRFRFWGLLSMVSWWNTNSSFIPTTERACVWFLNGLKPASFTLLHVVFSGYPACSEFYPHIWCSQYILNCIYIYNYICIHGEPLGIATKNSNPGSPQTKTQLLPFRRKVASTVPSFQQRCRALKGCRWWRWLIWSMGCHGAWMDGYMRWCLTVKRILN